LLKYPATSAFLGSLVAMLWVNVVQAACLEEALEIRTKIEANATGALDDATRNRVDRVLIEACQARIEQGRADRDTQIGRAGDTVAVLPDRKVHTTRGLKRERRDGLEVGPAPYFFEVEVEPSDGEQAPATRDEQSDRQSLR